MNDSYYYVDGEKYLAQVEFDESNPEARCPCILLLDTSGSMSGEPINELNQGLITFENELKNDDLASIRVEVAVISFGGEVSLIQDFVTADQFSAPHLSTSGITPMGKAILLALDMIKQRKKTYKDNSISYYRPWIFLITDGAPTDDWQQAAQMLKHEENSKSVAFFAVGVMGADMSTLRQISVRDPVLLKGLNFKDMFVWLSQSLTSVSLSIPGEQVALPPPTGWTQV